MSDTTDERGHRWFAAAYDAMSRLTEKRLGPMRERLLSGLTGDVLEIGAGTGLNFPHYTSAARVIALEPDPHMLKRAEARLVALGATNIDIRREPAEVLPFADASFDAVVTTLVLCTVRDVARSLAEARRVLRPGGKLVFLEHVRGDGMLGRAQDVVQPVWGWCSAGCHANRRTEDALRAAGFTVDDVKHLKMEPWMPAIIGTASVAPGAAPTAP
ncbi:MAG TPA: class I SAM-dependent methyltransferase [Dehalococcoidia bacterium]|nr:class I SAM-dependent methyltransferase [Dehalococcoidia bacterium]